MVRRSSLSDLVDFEELEELDGGDLRSVLEEVAPDQMLEALIGSPTHLRDRLLLKLSRPSAERIAAEIDGHAPIPIESARAAQRAVVEALCRLGRAGVVAFDDPEDMVA
jgi:flagellar motor switch protein FliG